MAETEADIGYGVIAKKGDGGSPTETFADFGLEITDVSGVGATRSAQDASHMQSPDRYTEMVYGLKTSKPFTISFNWIPENTAAIVAVLEGDPGNWQLLFADGTTCTVKAGITDLDISGLTPDGKMAASAVFTPSGKAVWA